MEKKSYDYGQDIYEKGDLLGHCYFHIPIKENFQGKELKIKITFTEEKSYSSLPGIVIMNDANSFLELASSNILVYK